MGKPEKVMIENVSGSDIRYSNFRGVVHEKYNPKGDRSFTINLNPEVGEALSEEGWYVRYKPNRGDENDLVPTLKIQIKWSSKIYIAKDDGTYFKIELSDLDQFDDYGSIERFSCSIVPYEWKPGVFTSRLKEMVIWPSKSDFAHYGV